MMRYLKSFLFVFIMFFIFFNLKIALAQKCDFYVKAPTNPEHVFHVADTVTYDNVTYYIPDPDYNVWPGWPDETIPSATICWTDVNNNPIPISEEEEGVVNATYPAASYILYNNETAYLLDVRTPEEWCWVGHPGPAKGECGGEYLEGKVINVAYKIFVYDRAEKKYKTVVNKFFIKDATKAIEDLGVFNPVIITMCRSGHRSVSAGGEFEEPSKAPWSVKAARILEELGIKVYNMLTGFEGGKDECGYRTLDQGWKNLGLPYNYKVEGAYWRPGL